MTRFEFIQKFGEQNKLAVAMTMNQEKSRPKRETPSANSSTFDSTDEFFQRNTPCEKTFLPAHQQTAGHSYYKGYFSPESFGSYQDVMDALQKPVSSYSLVYEHPSVHESSSTSTSSLKRKLESSSENDKNYKAIGKATPKYKPVSTKKNGGENKSSRFPKNAKSLMETGIFDGVPVYYVSFSKGKLLRATIQRNLYLCGCDLCHYDKTFSACELEKHALGGCKTSHPNNHIRFESGKTMHEVVKQLQSTHPNMLFGALETVTGSPINQEAFCAWKESFLASSQVVAKTTSQQAKEGGT